MNTRQARKARAQVPGVLNRRKVNDMAAILHNSCPNCNGNGLLTVGNEVFDCTRMEHHWAVIALQNLALKGLD